MRADNATTRILGRGYRDVMMWHRRFVHGVVVTTVMTTMLSAATRETPEDYEKRIIAAERASDLAVFKGLLAERSITISPDGSRNGKTELLDILRSMPPQNVVASNFVTLSAGRDAAIVTYVVTAVMPDGSVRQHAATSVWVRNGSGWLMVFHQGTAIPRRA